MKGALKSRVETGSGTSYNSRPFQQGERMTQQNDKRVKWRRNLRHTGPPTFDLDHHCVMTRSLVIPRVPQGCRRGHFQWNAHAHCCCWAYRQDNITCALLPASKIQFVATIQFPWRRSSIRLFTNQPRTHIAQCSAMPDAYSAPPANRSSMVSLTSPPGKCPNGIGINAYTRRQDAKKRLLKVFVKSHRRQTGALLPGKHAKSLGLRVPSGKAAL